MNSIGSSQKEGSSSSSQHRSPVIGGFQLPATTQKARAARAADVNMVTPAHVKEVTITWMRLSNEFAGQPREMWLRPSACQNQIRAAQLSAHGLRRVIISSDHRGHVLLASKGSKLHEHDITAFLLAVPENSPLHRSCEVVLVEGEENPDFAYHEQIIYNVLQPLAAGDMTVLDAGRGGILGNVAYLGPGQTNSRIRRSPHVSGQRKSVSSRTPPSATASGPKSEATGMSFSRPHAIASWIPPGGTRSR